MQWAGARDAFYAQEFRKTSLCLGKQIYGLGKQFF